MRGHIHEGHKVRYGDSIPLLKSLYEPEFMLCSGERNCVFKGNDMNVYMLVADYMHPSL